MKKCLLCLLCVFSLLTIPFGTFAAEDVTILFTHDMHSHLATDVTNYDGVLKESGGFGKLQSAVLAEKEVSPDALLVDGGDFSMGTLYQTIFTTDSAELRLMGKLGYDAVTLGNHEFDYRTNGLTAMLHAAMESGDILPDLLIANIDWEATLADGELADAAGELLSAMSELEVQPYRIYEKDGVEIAVFGLFGTSSAEYAPLSGLLFADPIESAAETVAQIEAEHPDAMILCLSHGGTAENLKDSEDQQLAMKVPEIDVIVSGHSHTVLEKPMIQGNTVIVSAGCYAQNLGRLTVSADGNNEVLDYELIPLNESIENDASMEEAVAVYTQKVNAEYLEDFSYTFDQVVAHSAFDFSTIEDFSEAYQEETLGNLIADSFIAGSEAVLGETVDFAVVPSGCVRSSFSRGEITAADIFDVYSLGSGADKKTGYPLVHLYVKGSELKNICEIDASISGLMSAAQLHFSGLSYTYNPHRLFMNRVTDVVMVQKDGTTVAVDEDKLYSVVADLYAGQMLGAVKDLSFGLLAITPLDQEGNPLDLARLDDFIIHKSNGEELKAWESLAMYMGSFEPVNGVPEVPRQYTSTDGRKVVEDNNNLMAKLSHPNQVFWVLVCAVVLILVVIAVIAVAIVKAVKRRQRKKTEKKE